jgi:formate C-acetyltransferase
VFDHKICTARELYDAFMSNWAGNEILRQRILNEVPRYGNDKEEADAIVRWSMNVFADAFKNCTCDREDCYGQAGIYPVSTNVIHGKNTYATPDGRRTHEPLADGISPMQGLDKNGPAAVLKSVSRIDHRNYANGTLLNMKFHPKTVEGEMGNQKLRHLVEAFFDLGGMHLQYNVIGSDTLRDAQTHPENYQNLVIRIAGFSAYFVELDKSLQDDLISRTDLAV